MSRLAVSSLRVQMAAFVMLLVLALAVRSDTGGASAHSTLAPHRFRVEVIVNYSFLKSFDARVSAQIGGSECGAQAGAASLPSELPHPFIFGYRYLVDVASADEKPGCGAPGTRIRWSVNGVEAAQDTEWPVTPGPTSITVSVGPMPMVVSGRIIGAEGLAGGETAKVTIGDHTCGVVEFARGAPRGVGGGDTYGAIVLPYEADSRCGRDGDGVQITIAGRTAVETVIWREGRQQADLTLADPETTAVIAPDERWKWLAAGLAFGFAGSLALLVCARLILRTVRP